MTVVVSLLTAVLLYFSLLVGVSHYDARSVSSCIHDSSGEECTIMKGFDLFKGAMGITCMTTIIILLLWSSRYLLMVL